MAQLMSLSNNKKLVLVVLLNGVLILLAVLFFKYCNPWVYNYYNAKLEDLPSNLSGYSYYFSNSIENAKTAFEIVFISLMIIISGVTFFLELELNGGIKGVFFVLTIFIVLATFLGMMFRLFLSSSIVT